jgi:hypothetical protein
VQHVNQRASSIATLDDVYLLMCAARDRQLFENMLCTTKQQFANFRRLVAKKGFAWINMSENDGARHQMLERFMVAREALAEKCDDTRIKLL